MGKLYCQISGYFIRSKEMPLKLRVALLFVVATSLSAQEVKPTLSPERHEYILHNFHTESGTVLPEVHLVYGTYGQLDAAGDNAILLPSHYMANLRGYEWLMKTPEYPAGALDPSRLFLITSELFGNGRSSSPSNTPEPFHGPRFPVLTIRDNVNAVHLMLTEELHIKHLKAVIGFSMGAQQAFQWAVSYPGYMDRIVATSGTAKTYGHGIVRLEGQIAALTADATFSNGDYTVPPAKGLEAFAVVWTGWLYSQEWWREELWRQGSKPGTTLEQYIDDMRHHFISGADANDLILQMRTWESNNVGNTPTSAPGAASVDTHPAFAGNERAALSSIKVPVLYMPSATDLYFPVTDARYEAQYIPQVTLLPIPSLWGHPAGAGASPADKDFLNTNVSLFLAGKPIQGEPITSVSTSVH
jgi:homoserine O-acetyltransferase/O-succinyltransferase